MRHEIGWDKVEKEKIEENEEEDEVIAEADLDKGGY